jgi:hypothetical protein
LIVVVPHSLSDNDGLLADDDGLGRWRRSEVVCSATIPLNIAVIIATRRKKLVVVPIPGVDDLPLIISGDFKVVTTGLVPLGSASDNKLSFLHWFLSPCIIDDRSRSRGRFVSFPPDHQFAFLDAGWFLSANFADRLINLTTDDACFFDSFSRSFGDERPSATHRGAAVTVIFLNYIALHGCVSAITSSRRNGGAGIVIAIPVYRAHPDLVPEAVGSTVRGRKRRLAVFRCAYKPILIKEVMLVEQRFVFDLVALEAVSGDRRMEDGYEEGKSWWV